MTRPASYTSLAFAAAVILALLATCAVTFSSARPQPPQIIAPRNPEDASTIQDSPVTKTPPKVLVIGGGLAGMAAAQELAEKGFSVTIKEGAPVLGGRLNSYPVQPFQVYDEKVLKNQESFPNLDKEQKFNVIHGLHGWFINSYHNFREKIIEKLGLYKNFRDWGEVDYVFRKYAPERIYSKGPYPLNLLGILARSPNFGPSTALGLTFALPDLAFFDYAKVSKYDNMTMREWAASKNVDKKFFDIILDPAAAVTLSRREDFSAAELLTMVQIYFLASPDADFRLIPTKPFSRSVIDPWADYLRTQLNVDIQVNAYVQGLRLRKGKIVGVRDLYREITEYDEIVLALDIPGLRSVLQNSIAEDAVSQSVLNRLRSPAEKIKLAPPYKVMRVWFDKALPKNTSDILETPEHDPINLIAQFHLIEDESAEWAKKTGGSVMEFHLYALDSEMADLEDDQIWDRIRPVVLDIYPQMADFKVLGYNVNSYENFPSFAKGQQSFRPNVRYPFEKADIANMYWCGDWIQTDFPSFLMERAVSTGFEAANEILYKYGVKQTPLKAVSNKGPGLF